MPLPPCTIESETTFVDVGRGVAIVSIEAGVRGAPCAIDAGGVIRAREEGRSPPELIAFRVEIGGRTVAMGGPRARVIAEVEKPGTVRFVAVLRGDRFVAAPLSTDPALSAGPLLARLRTRSVWGPNRIAGVARWVEIGAPLVVTVDATRDHELPNASVKIDRNTPIEVLIVDGGPMMGGDVTVVTEEDRSRALARGGVEALAVLLSDLPLSVATASDASAAVARLGEVARAARAAAGSTDPLIAAIGQRMATAIVRGFTTCVRDQHAMPPRWPTPPGDLVKTGLLDEAESGCPRVDDLLATNHPDVRFAQEGAAALGAANALSAAKLPRIGALTAEQHRSRSPRKPRRTAAFAGIAVLLLGLGLFVERASR